MSRFWSIVDKILSSEAFKALIIPFVITIFSGLGYNFSIFQSAPWYYVVLWVSFVTFCLLSSIFIFIKISDEISTRIKLIWINPVVICESDKHNSVIIKSIQYSSTFFNIGKREIRYKITRSKSTLSNLIGVDNNPFNDGGIILPTANSSFRFSPISVERIINDNEVGELEYTLEYGIKKYNKKIDLKYKILCRNMNGIYNFLVYPIS